MIALLTDFGTKDGYVASMKGVIYTVSPKAQVVDISHDVRPQNIYEAGFVLWQCYKFFPRGTIFAIVVDPYVGGNRKCIALKKNQYIFLAPDNGILSYILQDGSGGEIIQLSNTNFFQSKVSNTFHGRDIFASVAAFLENGIGLNQMGPELTDIQQLELQPPEITEDSVSGTVLYMDAFGNVMSNLSHTMVMPWIKAHPSFSILINDQKIPNIPKLSQAYCEVSLGQELLHFGSTDLLELAIREGNAAEKYNVTIGSTFRLIQS